MLRTRILKVRLSDDELSELDAAVALRGGTKAGLTRRFLADGLRDMGLAPELSLQAALAPFVEPEDWRVAAMHFYGWYALNVAELPPHVIALHLGHTDGGRLVRELYGHPDAALARERTRAAFRSIAPVAALPSTSSSVAVVA